MVTIANDNRGFLIAIVIVLALAIFSGGIRDNYSTGYAGLSSDYGPGYSGHQLYTECMGGCQRSLNDRRAMLSGPGLGGNLYDDFLDCQDDCRAQFGR